MDELLNNRVILFFIGLAFFFRIVSATGDSEKSHDIDNKQEFFYLLHEIKELRQEIHELKNSTRIESGNHDTTDKS